MPLTSMDYSLVMANSETTTTAAAVRTETTTTASTKTTNSGELFAEFISAPASSMSPAAIAEHMQQNQITFEIPTAHDLRHIDALHSFNTLLQRIGSGAGVSYDSSPAASISTEQLSNSVVLDLADLRNQNDAEDGSAWTWWEQIFGDADMHVIVNYLWIGVVTSLVLLSVIFIVFSCYFYRKFRTWKKCNKDIRAQVQAANDSYSSHGASHNCDASRLLQQLPATGTNTATAALAVPATGVNETGFYQIESPPCYTIATGLPSYDEALHHQQRHFAYGIKFVYPSLAAAHHHHHHHHHHRHHQQQQQQQHHSNQHVCITNWEKDAVQQQQQQCLNKLQKCKLSATDEQAQTSRQLDEKAFPAIYINMPDGQEQEQDQEQEPERERELHRNGRRQRNVASTDATQTLLPAAAADDDCASLVVVAA